METYRTANNDPLVAKAFAFAAVAALVAVGVMTFLEKAI
jgi:hypothetical protein